MFVFESNLNDFESNDNSDQFETKKWVVNRTADSGRGRLLAKSVQKHLLGRLHYPRVSQMIKIFDL